MTEFAVEQGRASALARSIAIATALTALAAAVVSGHGMGIVAPLAAAIIFVAVVGRLLLSWRALISIVVLIILFIPIKRYTLPASLPIRLEPYRLVVAGLVLAWLTSALIDPRVRLRRTHVIDAPLLVFVVAVLGSMIVNSNRVSSVGPDALKGLLFFMSFIAVLFLTVSLLRSWDDIDFIVRVLVVGGSVVALFALIESRTGYNVFAHLSQVVPVLRSTGVHEVIQRGSRLRVFASAQHPIALGAAFAMLVPLAMYRAICFRKPLWWICATLLLMATLATVSRTAILMLVVIGLVFVWLRAREMKRLWPLVIPAVLAIHFALPGTIGTLRKSFFPAGGVVAQQRDANVGSGRVATLGPALDTEFAPNPILGEGFATRITAPDEYVPVPNAPILDNQWLGTLLETGIVGVVALFWLFVRFVRRLGRAAKHDRSPRGWLLASIAASVAAYGESMLTYDAFSFIQVTFFLFILLALGSAAYALPAEGPARTA